MFTPTQLAWIVAAVCGAAIVYALVRGSVFLMPFATNRRDNPRTFYFVLAMILVTLAAAVAKI
jgi:hypothetical protein